MNKKLKPEFGSRRPKKQFIPVSCLPFSISRPSDSSSLLISKHRIRETIDYIRKNWDEITNYPFFYTFLDDLFDGQYSAETNLYKTFEYFTLLAVFIANLGLFGLVSFATQRRTKEIGIRKTLGASMSGMVLLLTKDYAKWILLANMIAWPIAYYAMHKWLQNFAYRIDLTIWPFYWRDYPRW